MVAMTFDGNLNWETDNMRSYNVVGSYAFAHSGFTARTLLPGDTLAGSNLYPASQTNWNFGVISGQTDVVQEDASQSAISGWNAATLSGTYMLMGNGKTYSQTSGTGYVLNATLWLRVA